MFVSWSADLYFYIAISVFPAYFKLKDKPGTRFFYINSLHCLNVQNHTLQIIFFQQLVHATHQDSHNISANTYESSNLIRSSWKWKMNRVG